MAKLSDRQKNNILAKWNTGTFTKVSLAKKYKVSEKIIRNIVDGKEPKHGHLVAEQVSLNERKKSELSPIEFQAVNSAVSSIEKDRKYINSLSKLVLKGITKSLNNGKAQKVITVGQGMGVSQSEVVEYPLQMEHYEKAINTIHKAGQTLGVVDSGSAKVEVNNQNNQQTNVDIVGYGVKTIEKG